MMTEEEAKMESPETPVEVKESSVEEPKAEEVKEAPKEKPKPKKGIKTHVSDAKKAKVKELAELMKKKTVMVISIKSLPSAQFQDIKKKLRSKAKVQVVKKSLVNFALDHCGIKELHDLIPYVDDSTAMLFSDADAFEISGILANEKSPAKAKAGQIAPSDIEVKAGPTDLLPGPDISALSAVGLAPKVEDGKIAVMQDKVIVKEGAVISEAHASIMAKLDIIPFEVGIEPVAAFDGDDKKVYADIKIDIDGMVATLEYDYGRAFAVAVDLGIVNNETLDMILGKAKAEEGIVSRIISGEPEPEVVAEAAPAETQTQEETKKEEPKEESAAGLASLFG
ncbi:50S ribosomal protein L10 [archaeon]|jgi:large subunit ribosomal protein L10|nr:50S ribosomal protein L10 [archaeon]MBT3578235.1 50S ribosomal protein L10 [archaeon]MBT6819844.1 50S ribosomal protein L10 [archaeon]MBT6955731.1 50S ribosomal protein L10 [archaeon]MBT7025626.1 50S ribosomal protein L10 [archaeon]